MTEKLTYKIEVFEGPMDLLLHLISKHKVSINDVPILILIEQYLEYVKQMQSENLDLASDFLEMAARLVYIKTVSLLPVHDEADQLAEELRGELTEYRDCQIMAGKLADRAKGFDFLSKSAETVVEDMSYTRIHESFELFNAYLAAVGKGKRKLPPPVDAFSGIIAHKIVSVSSRISYIMSSLRNKKRRKFISLFENSTSRSELVATFLALLALAKAKKVVFEGDGAGTDVVLFKRAGEGGEV